MKINLNLLPVNLVQDIEFDSSYYKNTSIKRLDKFHVKGIIKYNLSDEIEIDLEVNGNMYLEDAITLEEVPYPVSLKISENLQEFGSGDAQYLEKDKNILDIIEFLWENIVLEVPISYTTSSGVLLKGSGWELNGEKEEDIDPQLAKLKDLFKGGE